MFLARVVLAVAALATSAAASAAAAGPQQQFRSKQRNAFARVPTVAVGPAR